MKLHPRVSRAAVELVKRFEGFRPRAERLAAGGWIIGYGHTLSAREGASVGPADAEALLWFDLSRVAARVEAALRAPVTAPQFEALAAFAFSIGEEAFDGSSVLRRVNEGAYFQAASLIEAWRRAEFEGEPLVVDALVRRRAAEKAHFLTPPEGWVAAPSAVVRALPDTDPAAAGEGAERVAVAELRATPDGLAAHVADPPGRLGEPAPSAVLAAADSLRARLDRILGEPEPEPEPEPESAPEPGPSDRVQPEPERAPEPEPPADARAAKAAPSEREPKLSALHEAAVPSEPAPDDDAPEPSATAEASERPSPPDLQRPLFGAGDAPPPSDALHGAEPPPALAPPPPPMADRPTGAVEDPHSEAPPVTVARDGEDASVIAHIEDEELPPPRTAASAYPPRTDWLREEAGGRRRAPLWRRWLGDPAMLVFLFAAGAVMFIAALIGMTAGRPAVGGLVLGVAGVGLMAPAAGALLFRRMDRRRG